MAESIIYFMNMIPGILLGFTVHEYAHAWVAVRLGDNLPREQGRLTLNPLSHIDPIGFLLFLIAGYGWAKPVQINPAAYRNPQRDDLLVSLAGIAANLLTAAVCTALIKMIDMFAPGVFADPRYGDNLWMLASYCVWMNIVLAVFNLLPFPPLDGSRVVLHAIPDRYGHIKAIYTRYGSIAFLIFIIANRASDGRILPIGPIVRAIYRWLLQLFQF